MSSRRNHRRSLCGMRKIAQIWILRVGKTRFDLFESDVVHPFLPCPSWNSAFPNLVDPAEINLKGTVSNFPQGGAAREILRERTANGQAILLGGVEDVDTVGEERGLEVDREEDKRLKAILLRIRYIMRCRSRCDWVFRDANHQLPQPRARRIPLYEHIKRKSGSGVKLLKGASISIELQTGMKVHGSDLRVTALDTWVSSSLISVSYPRVKIAPKSWVMVNNYHPFHLQMEVHVDKFCLLEFLNQMMGKVNRERMAVYLGELQRKEDTNDRYVAALRGETFTRNPYARIQSIPKRKNTEADKEQKLDNDQRKQIS
ncbi:hypothetical protein POTOM_036491 [Populus tomentosa]|uniref:Uncharacterized protein n=1 Tax=Populus tomentosa TaxID=118781 RepID=A0A8X7Z2Z9_POPTO|nr:hypothetical protein POTOM_036491 [Populus tomentosa]